MFPRDPNPYQELLHAQLRNEDVTPAYVAMPTPSKTLNLLLLPAGLLRARLRGARILHLHWVFDFALPYAGRLAVLRLVMQGWFAAVLWWSRLIGLRLVWTAHNVLPHDRVFWNDRQARALVLRHADGVIVHDPVVVPRLRQLHPHLPPVTVAPHGDYAGWYLPRGTRQQARERLAIPSGERVLLFFGAVTADKGVPELVAAWARLCRERPGLTAGTRLVIAGRCTDPALEATVRSAARAHPGKIVARLGFVPDDEVGDLLVAADLLTLPFRTATTRGTVVLARSFAKPLLLPDLPALRSVPGDACLRYDPAVRTGLADALERACSTSVRDLEVMGERGRPAGTDSTWAEAARRTAALYREILSPTGVPATSGVS
ncbi:glycosyltransferase family 4 protein [Kineosporia sp. J2-2]|uniref:Glycosyltransferase family 4 protein n=1 Tax=Kineosporia corallincola TaxID=2835133 RepID=A0ABS5TLS4_9ACTN|nr:glycosyltransferase family 4 protein [Kineosporia corallincola]MBT0772041.1 glycosyltransferase family 4 protein [Kineosporia corallincola]